MSELSPGADATEVISLCWPDGADDWTADLGDSTTLIDFEPGSFAVRRSATVWATGAGIGDPAGGAVFVDQSGRRRRLVRWCGGLVAFVCVAFAVLLGVTVFDGMSAAPMAPHMVAAGSPDAATPTVSAVTVPLWKQLSRRSSAKKRRLRAWR